MNDTVITGAAIGALIMAAIVALALSHPAPSGFDPIRLVCLAMVCIGSGAAIGWLVS